MRQNPQESLKDPVKSDIASSNARTAQSLRKKLKLKEKELLLLREKSDTERDAMLRQIADLENLLRAKEREYSARVKNADKQLILDLLPFVDTLEAGSKDDGHPDLVVPIRNMILNILRRHGLEEVQTKGSRFDPYRHEVVGVVDDGEEGTVQEEVQKGYTVNNEVIRTAKVIVSKR